MNNNLYNKKYCGCHNSCCSCQCCGKVGPTGPTGPIGTQLIAGAMQIQLTDSIPTIADGEPLLFNNVLLNTSPNISYDPINGEITISANGLYYINWWLAIDGSTINPYISYTLEASDGTNIESCSVILSDNMNGNGLFNITTAPVTISLINTTGNDTFIGNVPVQSSLIIIQLTEI